MFISHTILRALRQEREIKLEHSARTRTRRAEFREDGLWQRLLRWPVR